MQDMLNNLLFFKWIKRAKCIFRGGSQKHIEPIVPETLGSL